MLMPAHDPRDHAYRYPRGAVPGGTVRLCITVPAVYNPSEVTLCVFFDTAGETAEYPMRPVPFLFPEEEAPACAPQRDAGFRRLPLSDPDWPSPDGRHVRWCAEADLTGRRGLVFYYFRLCHAGESPYYLTPLEPTPEMPYLSSGISANPPVPPKDGRFASYPQNGWQITVYDPAFRTPEWFGRGVTYQIFPDRFARSGTPLPPDTDDRHFHRDPHDVPEYLPDEDGTIPNNDFFGGNLAGIREKLPYLESLGVTTIYLNPVFEAYSNHRYDTADYERIDPLLGSEDDFRLLCRSAAEHGIRILMDGVFNHTGSDSRYFNVRGRYPGPGAARSKESPYYGWYRFRHWPDDYKCWWDVKILPAVDGTSGFLDYITQGEDCIVRRWLRAGASGWRLDVADELPEAFLTAVRSAAREEKPDALILGEVWEDASDKVSYGHRRHYFEGSQLDGVMNYPFSDALFRYLLGGDAFVFAQMMEDLLDRYPRPAWRCLMNILGTHDTVRALSRLGCPEPPADKASRAVHRMTGPQRERASALLRIASALQYLFPGSPDLYYGDEAGMEGFEDPFNRRFFPWGGEDTALTGWYRALGSLRRAFPALADADMRFPAASGAVLAMQRDFSSGGGLLLVTNRSGTPAYPGFPLPERASLLAECSTHASFGGILPPLSALVFRME